MFSLNKGSSSFLLGSFIAFILFSCFLGRISFLSFKSSLIGLSLFGSIGQFKINFLLKYFYYAKIILSSYPYKMNLYSDYLYYY